MTTPTLPSALMKAESSTVRVSASTIRLSASTVPPLCIMKSVPTSLIPLPSVSIFSVPPPCTVTEVKLITGTLPLLSGLKRERSVH